MTGDTRHDGRTMKYPSLISIHVLGYERALCCREQQPLVTAAASKHVCRASQFDSGGSAIRLFLSTGGIRKSSLPSSHPSIRRENISRVKADLQTTAVTFSCVVHTKFIVLQSQRSKGLLDTLYNKKISDYTRNIIIAMSFILSSMV